MAFGQPAPISYGYCDSFFVENPEDDHGVYSRAAAERERSRTVNKIRQKDLARLISDTTSDEYMEDVLDHMEHMELETMPDVHSIDIQTEIQWFMRPYLLDFLLEAHHAFQLLPETLSLAVNLLDRYCSRRVVYKRHYQLVGCAALLIASKYGDRKDRVPTVPELKSMCCSLYEESMFTQMEWHVLQTLDWMVGHATVNSFLDVALAETDSDEEVKHMATYICEMALYHKDFLPVLPSVMARSSLALARCVLGRLQLPSDDWATVYDSTVVLKLSHHLSQPSQTLFRKFAAPGLMGVSTTLDQFLQRHAAMAATQAMQYATSTPVAEREQKQQYVSQEPQQQPTPESSFCYEPSTPQKPINSFGPMGVLTPPITPENVFGVAPVYNGVQPYRYPTCDASKTQPNLTVPQCGYGACTSQPGYFQQ